MSTVRRISVRSHCNNLGGNIWNPAIRWTEKYAVFVILEDDDGRIGLGECWCFESSPKPLSVFIEHEVAPHILGAALADVNDISNRLTREATLSARHGILCSALSGFDIAVWDLRAQTENVPLHSLLNRSSDGGVPLYGSGGLYGKDKDKTALAAEMVGIAQSGFDLVKMKVNALKPLEDAARVVAVLDALPSQVRLIVDGVYSFTADGAKAFYDVLPVDRIEAFQSPIAASDISGMKALSRAGVPVMATEAEYRNEMHRALVEDAGIAFLQVAPVACGGITRLKEIQKLADRTPTRLSLEVSSTAIALMAASHFAAAEPAVAHVEYHTIHQVFFDLLDISQPDQSDVRHRLPEKPGLGLTLPINLTSPEFELTGNTPFQTQSKLQRAVN